VEAAPLFRLRFGKRISTVTVIWRQPRESKEFWVSWCLLISQLL
jgi:hypothetical protein